MKICITLDDVLRAKTQQFGKIYKKYIDAEIDLDAIEIDSDNLCKAFNFESKEKYNEFLYKDYSFEIFAEAPVIEKMLDKRLNNWLLSIEDEDVDFCLANPYEFNTSIGFTYFFLSQIATRIREVYLPKDSSDIWNKCDVLITACPKLLKEKPEGKKVVKIKAAYNEDIDADLTYDKLSDIFEDNEFIKKIKNDD